MSGFHCNIFADYLNKFANRDAVFCSDGDRFSYSELATMVVQFREKIPSRRGLAFILCRNDISTLVAYLACFQARIPMLLLDRHIDNSSLENLKQTYRPAMILGPRQTNLARGGNLDIQLQQGCGYEIHPELAILLSTSGSTGSPKQVKLSYRNLQANALSIAEYLRISENERAMTSLPFHYSYGLSVINSHLMQGASLILTDDSVISRPFWQQFDRFQPTSLAGVPHSYEMMRKIRVLQRPLHKLRYMTQAGGRLDKESVIFFAGGLKEKGIEFFVMYGQTEATARMSFLSPEEIFEGAGSIGRAIPGGRFHLVDNDGNKVNIPGIKGELVYQGDNVMMGYARSWTDLSEPAGPSVLATGDLATFDESGRYYLCGRKDRSIKVFGHRLDLDELQCRLVDHGFNVACAGEENKVVVAVLGQDGSVDFKNLTELLICWLPFNMSAVNVVEMTEFPKTASGKIAYAELLKVTA